MQQLFLLLVSLPFGATLKSGFLRRPSRACSDSDGISGFNFSHSGLWIPGYTLQGNGFTTRTCAEACSKKDSCVAFSGAFIEHGWNGACYLYSATGADTPSANDRAYRRCAPEPSGVPGVTGFNYGLNLLRAESTPQTASDLVEMASTMQGELDNVSKLMVGANTRMRRLKSMIAGESAILVNSSRLAFLADKLTTSNRDGLRAIARSRNTIGRGYEYLNTTEEKLDKVLDKLEKSRKAHQAAQSGNATPVKPLSFYEPNVTTIEDVMNNLTNPESLKAIDGLVVAYNKLKGNVTDVVDRVLRKNLRGLVDVQRMALQNFSDAVSGSDEKDPCCCP